MTDALCEDCPPAGYPTDITRCTPCPRRAYEKLVEAAHAYRDAFDVVYWSREMIDSAAAYTDALLAAAKALPEREPQP